MQDFFWKKYIILLCFDFIILKIAEKSEVFNSRILKHRNFKIEFEIWIHSEWTRWMDSLFLTYICSSIR